MSDQRKTAEKNHNNGSDYTAVFISGIGRICILGKILYKIGALHCRKNRKVSDSTSCKAFRSVYVLNAHYCMTVEILGNKIKIQRRSAEYETFSEGIDQQT